MAPSGAPPTPELEALESAALQLPKEDRERLAARILASLEEEDPDVEERWAAELNRRVAALRAGTLKTRPVDEFLDELDALLR